MNFLVDFAERYIKNLPPEEIGLKNLILFLEQRLPKARLDRDDWVATEDGKEHKGMSANQLPEEEARERSLQDLCSNIKSHK